jgi:hypothetical protein
MRVSEQHLDGAQIGTGIEQVSRERVPQGVRRDPLTGQHVRDHLFEHLADGGA